MTTAPTSDPAVRAWFPGLDAVRALGATGVVATHVAFETGRSVHGPLSATLARCDAGVALFFVLSGFLLFRPWAAAALSGNRRPPKTTAYLWRRALRILPVYWLAVVVCLGALPENDGRRSTGAWLRHLTLTQIYGRDLARFGLTQTWSLCTEVAFYLLLPGLAALVLTGASARQALLRLSLLAALSPLWLAVALHTARLDRADAAKWLPAFLDWFAVGMALAVAEVAASAGDTSRWVRRLQDLASSPSTCWWSAAAVFSVATSALAGPRSLEREPTAWEAITKNVLYLLLASLIVLPLVFAARDSESWLRVALRSRATHFFGEISYGIFLWHLLVLQLLVRIRSQALFTGSWTWTFLPTLAASIALATLSYRLLERPLMRRLKGLVPEGSAPAQTHATATMHSA